MTIMTDEELIARIEAFIERTDGMTPTRFGLDAVGEGGFINRLKAGRSVSLKLANRVLAFMAQREAEIAEASVHDASDTTGTPALSAGNDAEKSRRAAANA
jgi:hypothetical protein